MKSTMGRPRQVTDEQITKILAWHDAIEAWKAKRTGKYPKLATDVTVFVSEDGRWFFDGETMANPNPRPVASSADLAWLEQRTEPRIRVI